MLDQKQKEALLFLTGKLKENSVAFQVTGGLAAKVYGSTRPLYDIDLEVSHLDIQKVRVIFKDYIVDDFYHLQDNVFDIYLLSFKIDGVNVDIGQVEENYFTSPSGERKRIDSDLSKAVIIDVDGISVPVQDKGELLEYKRFMSREVDLKDIFDIENASSV